MTPNDAEQSQERPEEFYTLEEAAEILKVSKTTMRRYLGNGKVYGINLGKLWRIPKDVIERLKTPEDDPGGS
jgi:excisionase family DNA binding protein